MAVSEEEFKASLGCRATAVSIVTARDGEQIHGMTVSDFTSVSLRPPLVLVCADKASITQEVIEAGGNFAAHVLGSDQEALSNKFASKKEEHRRFEGIDWEPGASGAPILPGVIAVLDCHVAAAHDAGDHVIYVGEVLASRVAEGEPLVYCGGAYRSLS